MMPAKVARVARRVLYRSNKGNRGRELLTLAQHAEIGLTANTLGNEAILEGMRILHRFVVDADHHVAGVKPGLRRRTVGTHMPHERSYRRGNPEQVGEVGRDWLEGGAEPRPLHLPTFERGLNH